MRTVQLHRCITICAHCTAAQMYDYLCGLYSCTTPFLYFLLLTSRFDQHCNVTMCFTKYLHCHIAQNPLNSSRFLTYGLSEGRGALLLPFLQIPSFPVAARSKAWVCGRSPADIVGSNPTGGHKCLSVVSVVCCQVEVCVTG